MWAGRHGRRGDSIWRIRLCALGLAFTLAPAAAQTTLDAEELRRRTQREAEERQHRQSIPDSRLQLEEMVSDTLELPVEAPCFEIHTLRLEGERLEYFAWAQSYLDQYAGRCIGVQSVNLLVRRLANQFIDRGLITTRVGVPEQDLSAGTLRVRLIPGVIRDLRFSDPEIRGTWKSAFPSRPGDLLNLRDLEQGLEQMKRVPYQDVNLDIAPGGEAGESDVIIAVAREKPWKLIFSLDDSGSKATGELQASATLALNNPLGVNDLFYVTVNNDVEGAGAQLGSRGDSFSYSLPWGYWTFGVSGSRFRFHQTIQGQSQRFTSEGESDQAELKIQRVIHRDQASKSGVQLRLVKRHNKSFIDDIEIESSGAT